MNILKDKTVLITGASSGIGAAAATAFARLNTRLLLCARRLDSLTTMTEALLDVGATEVYNFRLDVQDRAAVAATIADLPEEWKKVDVLVNNAGLSRGLAKVFEDSIDDWEEMIDTNVKGLLYMTRAVVPGMVERGSGHVINIGSTAGHQTYANGAVYCATKAAERVLTEGLRIDTIGKGIRVTSIDPGMTETSFSEVRFHGDADRAKKVYENITPLQATDVADAIVYAATRPAHMQVQMMTLTPTDQANSTTFNRRG